MDTLIKELLVKWYNAEVNFIEEIGDAETIKAKYEELSTLKAKYEKAFGIKGKPSFLLKARISTGVTGKPRYTEDEINAVIDAGNAVFTTASKGTVFITDKTQSNKIMAVIDQK